MFKPMNSTKPTMEHKNVAGGQLAIFSKDPPTGHHRDGYCRVTEDDKGNHSIAALVSDEFLDFSANKGNNLKDAGVKGGMKWCLCAHRWQEAYDAFKDGKLGKEAVPKVFLHASDESALNTVSYKTLKEFEHPREAGNQLNRQQSHYDPDSGRTGAAIRETTELSGRDASAESAGKTRGRGS